MDRNHSFSTNDKLLNVFARTSSFSVDLSQFISVYGDLVLLIQIDMCTLLLRAVR